MPALRNSLEKTHVAIAELRRAPIAFIVSLYYNIIIIMSDIIIINLESIKMLKYYEYFILN